MKPSDDDDVKAIRDFLAARRKMLGMDPDLIHALNTGPDGEGQELRVSVLERLLARLEAAERTVARLTSVRPGDAVRLRLEATPEGRQLLADARAELSGDPP